MTQNPSICKSMSGVWERKISVHTILASMLKMHGKSLDNESLLILMTEVEGILNSWPLAVEMINDPSSFQPLSLANILTIKSKVVMPPPGKFQRPDLYCRRQWRRVQHIASEFWSCRRKKYWQSFARASEMEYPKKKFFYWCHCAIQNPSVSLKIGDQPKKKKQTTLWNDLLLYSCSKVMCSIPAKDPTDVVNLVITRGAICNCTFMKCSLEQSARWKNLFVKKLLVELKLFWCS